MKVYSVTTDALSDELRKKYVVLMADEIEGILLDNSSYNIDSEIDYLEFLNKNVDKQAVLNYLERISLFHDSKDILLVIRLHTCNENEFFCGPALCRWLGFTYEAYTTFYNKAWSSTYDYSIIRVSSSAPAWFNIDHTLLPEIYPEWRLIRGIKCGAISQADYTVEYSRYLSALNKSLVNAKLMNLYVTNNCKPLLLVCWCHKKKGFFCHRQLVAVWLDNNITELE